MKLAQALTVAGILLAALAISEVSALAQEIQRGRVTCEKARPMQATTNTARWKRWRQLPTAAIRAAAATAVCATLRQWWGNS